MVTLKVRSCALALAASCLLLGCGGEESSSPSPGTAPTPLPSATPSPTPTSPPPLVRAFAASEAVCFVYMEDPTVAPPNNFTAGYCDREGNFGPGVRPLAPFTEGAIDWADLTTHAVYAVGVDRASSMPFLHLGPRPSSILSPLTTMMLYGGQPGVKSALGLVGGPFELASDRDLTGFDAVAALSSPEPIWRADGARVIAANLRAMVLATAVEKFARKGFGDPNAWQWIHRDSYDLAGRYLTKHNQFAFTDVALSAMLGDVTENVLIRPDVLAAAAHLVTAYSNVIGPQVSDAKTAGQLTLGIAAILHPELKRLRDANSAADASAVMRITEDDLRDRLAVFLETIPFPTSGRFFAAPNMFELRAGTVLVAPAELLVANDLYAQGSSATPATGAGLFPSSETRVVSVSVPAARASQIGAVFDNGSVKVQAFNGFVGTSYFDYVARHPSGETATARVYVTFR